jgi:hypothetical protein
MISASVTYGCFMYKISSVAKGVEPSTLIKRWGLKDLLYPVKSLVSVLEKIMCLSCWKNASEFMWLVMTPESGNIRISKELILNTTFTVPANDRILFGKVFFSNVHMDQCQMEYSYDVSPISKTISRILMTIN